MAILMDATLVRAVLVPAFMRLAGNANWWAPAPLRRLYGRVGLSEVEPAPAPARIGGAWPEVEAAAEVEQERVPVG